MKQHLALRVALLTGFVCVTAIATRGGPPYEISRRTADGGGSTISGGGYELSGTIGQPDAGHLFGAGLELSGGFWFPGAAGDTNEDGLVDGIDFASFWVCLGGPGVTPEPNCAAFDFNRDGSVDLVDLRSFQLASTGP